MNPISNEKYLLIEAKPTQKRYSHLKIEGCHYLASGQIKAREIDFFNNTNPILLLRYFNFFKIPSKTNSNDFCSSWKEIANKAIDDGDGFIDHPIARYF